MERDPEGDQRKDGVMISDGCRIVPLSINSLITNHNCLYYCFYSHNIIYVMKTTPSLGTSDWCD